jgi:hypothetical protein
MLPKIKNGNGKMTEQLESCVSCLFNVTDLIRTGYDAIDTRNSVLDGIIGLNFVTGGPLGIGKLCYAPRYVNRTMDVAIIVKYNAINESNECSIVWVFPRNKYELFSIGSSMDISCLRHYLEDDYIKQINDLDNLKRGDNVYVLSNDGYFVPGKVTSEIHIENDIPSIDIEVQQNNKKVIITKPLNILHVIRDNDKISLDGNYSEDSGSYYSSLSESSDDDNENNNQEIKQSQSVSSNAQSIGLLQHQGYNIGEWEKHTKGFESHVYLYHEIVYNICLLIGFAGKLMYKMGYTRFVFICASQQ